MKEHGHDLKEFPAKAHAALLTKQFHWWEGNDNAVTCGTLRGAAPSEQEASQESWCHDRFQRPKKIMARAGAAANLLKMKGNSCQANLMDMQKSDKLKAEEVGVLAVKQDER